MILLAHIQGVPVEEFLTPLAGSLTAGLLLVSSLLPRIRRVRRY